MMRFRSILVLNGDIFVLAQSSNPRISPLISTRPKGSRSHTTLASTIPGLAWDESAVCPDFSDKDSKWMGHDLSNGLHRKPRPPLLILCNFRMRQQKYTKKHVQSSPWLAVHGFKQFHLFWWLLSVKKNLSSLLFRCFLPAAGRGI